MINNTLNDKQTIFNKITSSAADNTAKKQKKPDDHGGFYFSSKLKIFDPNTNEIFVQKRGD